MLKYSRFVWATPVVCAAAPLFRPVPYGVVDGGASCCVACTPRCQLEARREGRVRDWITHLGEPIADSDDSAVGYSASGFSKLVCCPSMLDTGIRVHDLTLLIVGPARTELALIASSRRHCRRSWVGTRVGKCTVAISRRAAGFATIPRGVGGFPARAAACANWRYSQDGGSRGARNSGLQVSSTTITTRCRGRR